MPYAPDRRSRRAWLAVVVVIVVGVAAWMAFRAFAPGPVKTGSVAAHGATIIRYDLHSRRVGRSLRQVAVMPPDGGEGRPLLVFLHGRGSGAESNAKGAFFDALDKLGQDAPAVVFPSGGDHSYWHDRADGDWAGYVLDEVIPMAAKRLKTDPDRIAIGGISMGGYGAYEIARQRPDVFCAIGGHSAANWLVAGDSASGAFDDAEDFDRHAVVGLAQARGSAPWGQAKLWLDGGDEDPFLLADQAFAEALGIPFRNAPGGHDGDYWDGRYDEYLRFYASALKRC